MQHRKGQHSSSWNGGQQRSADRKQANRRARAAADQTEADRLGVTVQHLQQKRTAVAMQFAGTTARPCYVGPPEKDDSWRDQDMQVGSVH